MFPIYASAFTQFNATENSFKFAKQVEIAM